MTTSPFPHRRGVTLLLVLSLMTMFAMLIITFMLVTTNARKASQTAAKAVVDPNRLVDEWPVVTSDADLAMTKLLVGGLDSVIGPHGILENLYGHPVFGDTEFLSDNFDTVTADGLDVNNKETFLRADSPLTSSNIVTQRGDYLVADLLGYVLTVVDVGTSTHADSPKLVGKSTFVLDPFDSDGQIRFAPFNNVDLSVADQATALDGCKYIINSPAFSGTGPGFLSVASGSAQLGDHDGNMPFALRPNVLAPESDGTRKYIEYLTGNRVVMMNPDYTAPDYLNMFLAWNDVDVDNTKIKSSIPSYHRPALVNYWKNQTPAKVDTTTNPGKTALRKTVLRPLPTDHPNFTGSNPAAVFSNLMSFLTDGPWDVDTDGDGIPDAIWLDVGLPPIMIDGKMHKRLVAYHVLDMDGRLNVNVHGNKKNDGKDGNGGTDANGDIATIGVGMGTAEVRLDHGLSVLSGTAANVMNGRYGDDNEPGIGLSDTELHPFTAGYFTENNHYAWWRDPIAQITGINPLAYGYDPDGAGLGFGGIQPDLWGTEPLRFDASGNRIYSSTQYYEQNPYLMNPYARENDTPFNALELQFLLRSPGDLDYSNLPERLRDALGENNFKEPSSFRLHITTRSSNIPAASRFGGRYNNTVYAGLFMKAYQILEKSNTKFEQLYYLLPAELRRGEKINLNGLTTNPAWPDPEGYYHGDLLKEKARFAQSIFYTMLLVCYDEIFTGITVPADREEAIKRLAQWSVNLVDFIDNDSVMTPFIFSTDPFSGGAVYDNADDIAKLLDTSATLSLGSNVLIWGMEKPAIAMTETLAFHNRRAANAVTKKYEACGTTDCPYHKEQAIAPNGCPNHDKSFNQVMIPQGSLYIEIFRNDNHYRSGYTSDLYEPDGVLNLAQRVYVNGDETGDFDYVWRIAASRKTCTAPNFDWGDANGRSYTNDALYQTSKGANKKTFSLQTAQWPGDTPVNGEIVPERIIWFGTQLPTAQNTTTIKPYSYYNRTSENDSLELFDDEYLVIGPRALTTLESDEASGLPEETLPFGKSAKTLALSDLGSKQIIAAADVPTGWTTGDTSDIPYIGINVSEPLPDTNYYAQPTEQAGSGGLNEVYSPAQPASRSEAHEKELHCFGTIPAYSSLFLQRLADPRRPHDPVKNPYITVDWNMADLHVFNSETAKMEAPEIGATPPSPAITEEQLDDDKKIEFEDIAFGSRQWGRDNPTGNTNTHPNLWNRVYDETKIDAANTDAKKLAGLHVATSNTLPAMPDHKFGDANTDLDPTAKAFLHFPWHDAPLNNTYESMIVPTCSPDRFSVEFFDTLTAVSGNASSLGGTGSRFYNPNTFVGPYLNFYGTTAGIQLPLTNFLDMVRVPSRFNGSLLGWAEPYTINSKQRMSQPIYAMREPGKINLNTAGAAAWAALRGCTTEANWPYDDLTGTRTNEGLTRPTEGFPTEMATPFRASSAVELVPDDGMVRDHPSETGILRKRDTTKELIPRNTENKDSDDAKLNPYTLSENVMRMSDLVTTRSNVFAVWVTVGYFEVEKFEASQVGTGNDGDILEKYPALTHIDDDNFSAVYPDGYVLGKERGLGNGTVKRHRAFYLIDRSTPVGFRRGNTSLNHEDVIIYKKVLE